MPSQSHAATPVIRPAEPSDRAALHALLTRSWLTVWAPHCQPSSVERFRREDPVAAALDEGLAAMRVAVVDGAIAGQVTLVGDHLDSIDVDPRYWGRGIGTALMDDAQARGAARLAVRAFNTRAIRFYERRGWRLAARFMGTELGTPMETLEYRRQPAARRT